MVRRSLWLVLVAVSLNPLGCAKPATSPAGSGGTTSSGSGADSSGSENPATTKPKRTIKPVEIGATGSSSVSAAADSGERVESARAALKPSQILIGDWNGTSRNAVLDEPNWAWDLKSDPKQPALRLVSEKGKYIRDGRLTFFPSSQEFEMTAVDGEGKKRVFRGNFTQEIQDVPGEDKKLRRTYKLELTEPRPDDSGEQWRVVINQQENNRYILEVDRKRGSGAFFRVDTINTQREGTSFALSDTDYGEKTCIISQGLGTISVSYMGKSYWVCCTGCKAAFEDDPEKWIAKWEGMNKDKMSKQ